MGHPCAVRLGITRSLVWERSCPSRLYPFVSAFRKDTNERWYYTLLMSTGLTFGTISALYGLSHGLVSQEQYSFLVAAVIASAVVPTMIAGLCFVPTHLIPKTDH